jgi:hypothetical protein
MQEAENIKLVLVLFRQAPHKGVFHVSSLSTREGSDGSSNALRRWLSDKSEKRAGLLQEDHLNWPDNQINVKQLLTL